MDTFTPRRSKRLATKTPGLRERALETHKVAISKEKNKTHAGHARSGRAPPGWKGAVAEKTPKRKHQPPTPKAKPKKVTFALKIDIPKLPTAGSSTNASATGGGNASNVSWPEWFSDGPLTPVPDPNLTLNGRAFTWNNGAYRYQPPGKFTSNIIQGETRAPVSDFLEQYVPDGPGIDHVQRQPCQPGGPQRLLRRDDSVATDATDLIPPDFVLPSPPKSTLKKGRARGRHS
ncbi:hypothetical protein BKA70DRAFT_1222321 [Coprinopsis sp. MPI-PUGE-AT-0042]|nr:hypothetical protein BKA70DRAFT_1222321 [Coprinopsis sp. MPI-PUGE-AT-0042]